MRRSLLYRGLALILIGLWIAPGAGALVIGLHVAEHHRGHDADRHDTDHGDQHHHDVFVQEPAAAHGHRHDASAPDHDHSATGSDAAESRLNTIPTFGATSTSAAVPRPDHRGIPRARLQRGPADPLFYAHCSLLL